MLDLEGRRYVLQGYPHTDWVANLRAAGHLATLTVGRRTERVRLVELDPAAAVPVLRAWPVRVAQGAKIMKDAGVVAEAMVALTLANAVLEKFGGDSVGETRRNLESYLASIPEALRTEIASAGIAADRV